jgi:exonuclease V gamma subunit
MNVKEKLKMVISNANDMRNMSDDKLIEHLNQKIKDAVFENRYHIFIHTTLPTKIVEALRELDYIVKEYEGGLTVGPHTQIIWDGE